MKTREQTKRNAPPTTDPPYAPTSVVCGDPAVVRAVGGAELARRLGR